MKCPNCGYDTSNPFNYTPLVKREIDKRSIATQLALRHIFDIIKKYHNISVKDIYNFILNVKDIEDNVLRHVINMFYAQDLYYKKSLLYLKGMVINTNKTKGRLIDNERKTHGTRPPNKEIK